jgi:uncharacterized protein (TIGR03083 family)
MAGMDHLVHCDLLEDEIERFAVLAETASPSSSVPSCPAWQVSDLVRHMGTIHRWAERLVATRSPGRVGDSDMGLETGPANGAWIREGGAALLETLRAADPTAAMWAWGKDQHVAFWSRRELHETLVHRFDLELATGLEPSAPAFVAADTVAEFLDNLSAAEYFSPNVARLRGNGERLAFCATDTGDTWTVTLHPDHFDIDATVSSASARIAGPALQLALVLYRRLALGESRLELDGALGLAEFWLANSALE